MTGYLHNFDVSNGVNVLRLICGLVFIPHIVGKLNFFKAAKFNPPATWMYIAGAIETLLTIGLVSAIYTPYALVAAFHLFVVGAATHKVAGKWI
jgi:putative oxidoreductase